MKFTWRFNIIFIISIHVALIAKGQEESRLNYDVFKNPPASSGVHAWWHWIDGNITKDGICKDLEAMGNQGITQATIFNVGLFNKRFFELKEIKFDSPEWYEMFRYALQKADSLGIKIGAHNCEGWSTSGGPWIKPEHAMKEITWRKQIVKGGKYINKVLMEPYAFEGFYHDVAILAIPTHRQKNSFVLAEPKIRINREEIHNNLCDGSPVGGVKVVKGDTLYIDFDKALSPDKLVIHPRKSFMWGSEKRIEDSEVSFSLKALISNKVYRSVKDFKTHGFNKTQNIDIPEIKTKSFQLVIDDIENTSSFYIGELELLRKNEFPSYYTNILNHQIKTASVQGSTKNQYFQKLEKYNPLHLEDVIDLTKKVDESGVLKWNAPVGDWEIIRFGYTLTGSTNHPATESGKGFECDKMDTIALNSHYHYFPKKLIKNAGKHRGRSFTFFLIDSWESYFQNWTKAFPSEFEKLNGYSIIKWIPVLCGEVVGSSKSTESFLYDFRRTIAKLIEKKYYKHFADLCHRDGMELHGEVIYGGSKLPPIDVMKAYSYIDMPMFEFWARPDKNMLYGNTLTAERLSQFASSAGLFYGKSVVGSEAYTGNATYTSSPWDLKPFGDVAYCSGINQMILHSYVHQPTEVKAGLTLKDFGLSFNRNNTIWSHLSGWMNFQARIQYILQNSKEANDILFYIGDVLPQFNVDAELIPNGYSFNVCNSDILKNKLYVEDHKIKTEYGASFSLLVLPNQYGIDYSTLLQLEELLKQGAFIYGKKPLYLNSLADRKLYSKEFIKLTDQIWGKNADKEIKAAEYGKGKIIWGMPLSKALKTISLSADFMVISGRSKDFIFSHRHSEAVEVYYVANQQSQLISARCKFRVKGKSVEIWDPLTGKITSATDTSCEDNSTIIGYNFKPLESVFFIIRKDVESLQCMPPAIITNEYEVTEFKGSIVFSPAYKEQIEPVEINEFIPLFEFENPDIKYFAGKATYIINFKFPHIIDTTKNWFLDVGHINGTACLSLNNRKLEDVWSPLQEMPVNNIIKTGENELIITIDIPYRNRFIGDFIQYGEIKSLWTTCEIGNFLNAESPLQEVGLVEPAKIIAKTK